MTKRIISAVFALLVSLALSVTALAAADTSRLYDGADILTDAQETALLNRLDSISEEYKVDVIIATVETVGNLSADRYVENFYDENGYGYGEGRDGVLLLVAMAEREYRILSNGFGAQAISTDDIDYIGELISPWLSDSEYATAFEYFVDECEYEINGEINGFPFEFGINLIIALAIGFVVALIATGIMRAKLRSVRKQLAATEYTKRGSMKVTTSTDLFLYSTVNRRKKETNSSGSARSVSSSRNVGGGKF